ncbi:hypothetical protein EVAR_50776_1 [Eumeta japonica]|uniref:Uncharacterized protein n=1 Tax=Eumeta variegata TaxID=151549 RepID=A0A4C1WTZ5_EUMVA|nr:hypothetical protein EVAR_50776_1 [Eumeta japonica]
MKNANSLGKSDCMALNGHFLGMLNSLRSLEFRVRTHPYSFHVWMSVRAYVDTRKRMRVNKPYGIGLNRRVHAVAVNRRLTSCAALFIIIRRWRLARTQHEAEDTPPVLFENAAQKRVILLSYSSTTDFGLSVGGKLMTFCRRLCYCFTRK